MSFLQTISWVARTFTERRRSLRERVRYSGWVDIGDGSLPRPCAVVDVSEDGARIMVAPDAHLPPEFSLVFTRYGRISRRCRLVWRRGVAVGVEYLGPLECEEPDYPGHGGSVTH